MLRYAGFHQSFQCLPCSLLTGIQNEKGYFQIQLIDIDPSNVIRFENLFIGIGSLLLSFLYSFYSQLGQ